jgi:hypothetical protein
MTAFEAVVIGRRAAIAAFALISSWQPIRAAESGAHSLDPRSPRASAAPSAEAFVENCGQWDSPVRFVARLPSATIEIETDGISIVRHQDGESASDWKSVHLGFDGATSGATVEGLDPQFGTYNFFRGNDRTQWVTDVGTFGRVRYRGIYHGVDVVVRFVGAELEYDLVVAPGGDVAQVRVRCDGIDSMSMEHDGSLVLSTPTGTIRHAAGACWESLPNGERRSLSCCPKILEPNVFGFDVEEHDPALELVIDPSLQWSTYLGSSTAAGVGDEGYAIATGPNGDVTVVGRADWVNFPTTSGAYQHTTHPNHSGMAFVTRLRASDGALVYSSLISGSGNENRPMAVAVDNLGRATVGGWTTSPDFPVTPGAFDTVKTYSGGSGFVLRMTPTGNDLEFSTFLEGATSLVGAAQVLALVVDKSTGAATVGGFAQQTFPTTPGCFQPLGHDGSDGFVARLDPAGSSLVWATYVGATGEDQILSLSVDDVGQVVFTGETNSTDFPVTPNALQRSYNTLNYREAFVGRLSADGAHLPWCTYLAGFFQSSGTFGRFIAPLDDGGVIVAGGTTCGNFPTTPGAYLTTASPAASNGFISRFDATGALSYSTLLNAGGVDIYAGAVDGSGVVSLSGICLPPFTAMAGSFQPNFGGGPDDAFVARLNPTLSKLFYSTFLGGSGEDFSNGLSISSTGRVAVVGTATSGYPTTPNAFMPNYPGAQTAAFVTTLDLVLNGVSLSGESTQACNGPLVANATSEPYQGNQAFGLYCTGAPPNAVGRLLVGAPSSVLQHVGHTGSGQHPLFGIDQEIAVLSDSLGYVETSFPLAAGAAGQQLVFRYEFTNPPACPGSSATSTSNLVKIVVLASQ